MLFRSSEVASSIGISRDTLYEWLKTGRLKAPEQLTFGKKTQYLWTDKDIEIARAVAVGA